MGAREVTRDRRADLALAAGQGERQPRVERLQQSAAADRTGLGRTHRRPCPTLREHQLQRQRLVVAQPVLSMAQALVGLRAVDRTQCAGQIHQAVLGQQHLGQRVGQRGHAVERGLHAGLERAQSNRPGERVDRDDATGERLDAFDPLAGIVSDVVQRLGLWRLELQRSVESLHLAGEQPFGADRERLGHPHLVEERHVDLVTAVGQGERGQVQLPAVARDGLRTGPRHPRLHGDRFAHDQLAHIRQLAALAVPPRVVPEQVATGVQVEVVRERFRDVALQDVPQRRRELVDRRPHLRHLSRPFRVEPGPTVSRRADNTRPAVRRAARGGSAEFGTCTRRSHSEDLDERHPPPAPRRARVRAEAGRGHGRHGRRPRGSGRPRSEFGAGTCARAEARARTRTRGRTRARTDRAAGRAAPRHRDRHRCDDVDRADRLPGLVGRTDERPAGRPGGGHRGDTRSPADHGRAGSATDNGAADPARSPPPPLRAEGLGVTVNGRRVFAGFNAVLDPHSVLVVAAPSGTGRSTLLLTLTGRFAATSGRLEVAGGHRPRTDPAHHRRRPDRRRRRAGAAADRR